MADADLAAYGLARCAHCRRILLAGHLARGQCRERETCAAAAMIAGRRGRWSSCGG